MSSWRPLYILDGVRVIGCNRIRVGIVKYIGQLGKRVEIVKEIDASDASHLDIHILYEKTSPRRAGKRSDHKDLPGSPEPNVATTGAGKNVRVSSKKERSRRNPKAGRGPRQRPV